MKTETEHLMELEDLLKQATSEATALGFYRNQRSWMQIAMLLDATTRKVHELGISRARRYE
jgi:hypothetical protein